jgi:hypothetical protein
VSFQFDGPQPVDCNYIQGITDTVISRHHKLATHLVELVPTHGGGAVRRIGIDTNTEAELIVVDIKLAVEDAP